MEKARALLLGRPSGLSGGVRLLRPLEEKERSGKQRSVVVVFCLFVCLFVWFFFFVVVVVVVVVVVC